PRGLSLHIGINEVSADAYEGWTGPLAACEADAHDMAALAVARGLKASLLITPKATRRNVLRALRAAA
ncbi:MAG: caspase family protein, partial [Pseudomonas stutzeri]|nr:caspase family protein [Stutzerimonas stutzeri]